MFAPHPFYLNETLHLALWLHCTIYAAPSALMCVICRGLAPLPMGQVRADGDIIQPAGSGGQTSEQWRLMALASGWSPELPKRKALDEVFGSLLINLGAPEGDCKAS